MNRSHLAFPPTLPPAASGTPPTWRRRLRAALRGLLDGSAADPGPRPDGDAAYRAMFHAHPHPMWVFDLATLRFLEVNEAAIRTYGYSRAEFLSMTLLDIRPAEEHERALQSLRLHPRLAAPAQATDGAWTHVCKDGRRLEVEAHRCDVVFQGRAARMVLLNDVTEPRRLQRELAAAMAAQTRAHAELQQVMARVSDGFMALDAQGRFTHANARAAQVLGLPAESMLVGRTAAEVLPAPAGTQLADRLSAALRQGRPSRFELRLAAPGSWCEMRIFPSDDGATVYAADVSAQRRAREALRQSELQFRLLAERLPAIIYRAPADASAPCTYVSPAIDRLGYTPAQWMSPEGSNWAAVTHPEDRARVAEEVAAAAAARGELDLAYRLHDSQGRWRDFIDHGRFVETADGQLEIQGVMVEVTELRRTEQALREAEAYQRSLFEAMAEGVILLDAHQRIIEINPAMAEQSGYAANELMRMSLNDLLDPGARCAGADGQAVPPLQECEILRKDGRRLPAEVSVRPVHQGCSVLVLRDITERRKAESASREHKIELSALTGRLLAQERETTRVIAQTLHEQVGQLLTVARLRLDATAAIHGATMSPALHGECLQLADSLDRAMLKVRSVLHELRPALLEEQGLIAALDNEVRSRTVDTSQPDVLLELDEGELDRRWPAEVEYAAFMIAREAIVDGQQREGCTLVRVVLSGDAGGLQLEVIDDGRPGGVAAQRTAIGHLGLAGMRERAAAIGGQFAAEYNSDLGNSVSLLWQEGPS